MNRNQALKLINNWTKNPNLIKHMLAVEAQMGSLAVYFKEDKEKWALAGLLHDADYEKWPKQHPKKLLNWLKQNKAPSWLYSAIKTHAWKYNGMDKKPQTKLDWALYTCDELSGLIIAVALTRPDKKLSSVSLNSIKKKWKQKAFAAGVHRRQIELCQEKLNIPLDDFITICLKALQRISNKLNL